MGKIGRIASEEVTLQLIKSKCIPVLLYCLEACPLNKTQTQSLDFVINRLFMNLFIIRNLCSAIMPLYNCCETVSRAIRFHIAQSCTRASPHWHCIAIVFFFFCFLFHYYFCCIVLPYVVNLDFQCLNVSIWSTQVRATTTTQSCMQRIRSAAIRVSGGAFEVAHYLRLLYVIHIKDDIAFRGRSGADWHAHCRITTLRPCAESGRQFDSHFQRYRVSRPLANWVIVRRRRRRLRIVGDVANVSKWTATIEWTREIRRIRRMTNWSCRCRVTGFGRMPAISDDAVKWPDMQMTGPHTAAPTAGRRRQLDVIISPPRDSFITRFHRFRRPNCSGLRSASANSNIKNGDIFK